MVPFRNNDPVAPFQPKVFSAVARASIRLHINADFLQSRVGLAQPDNLNLRKIDERNPLGPLWRQPAEELEKSVAIELLRSSRQPCLLTGPARPGKCDSGK